MLREVDARRGLLHPRKRRGHGLLGGRDEGDDGPVVRRIARDIEHGHSIDRGDGIAYGRDRVGVSTFGKIGNALDEFHALKNNGRWNGIHARMSGRGA